MPREEVDRRLRPEPSDYGFDLDLAAASVVGLHAQASPDAFTAETLGMERIGAGVLVRKDGLILTIGYLITEAENIVLTAADGRTAEGHALGFDAETGFGFVQALTDLDLPVMPIGDSRRVRPGDRVVMAGAGGRRNAVAAEVVARETFAGYWEYLIDGAIFTSPPHPLWSGAALIGDQGDLIGVGSLQVQQAMQDGQMAAFNMSPPVELLSRDLDAYIASLRTRRARPWLGVFTQEGDGGTVILGVAPGGPAERAGLRSGDLIRAIDGAPASGLADFYRRLWDLGEAGVAVPLRLEREGDVFDVDVRSGDRRRFLKSPRLN